MLTAFKNLFNQNKSETLEQIINYCAFLVDVRTPQEFASGSVVGAINIPLDQVQRQIDKFKIKNTSLFFVEVVIAAIKHYPYFNKMALTM